MGPENVNPNPPVGYVYLKNPSPQVQDSVAALATLIGLSELGAEFKFPVSGANYLVRVEPLAPNEKNKEWHKGGVVYIEQVKGPLPHPKDLLEKSKNPKFVGASSGAVAGFYVGGPIGAIVGSAVGYVGGLIFNDVKKK